MEGFGSEKTGLNIPYWIESVFPYYRFLAEVGRQAPFERQLPHPISPKPFPPPNKQPDRTLMDVQLLYVTFTNKKVVTSMLLLGIVLGLVLSALTRYFAGKWYMPTAFVGICLVVAIMYMYWLDRQDWRDM